MAHSTLQVLQTVKHGWILDRKIVTKEMRFSMVTADRLKRLNFGEDVDEYNFPELQQ
jgi:hypothetical protein